MNKLLSILLMLSFTFTQEPCEGTCLSEEERLLEIQEIGIEEFPLEVEIK